MYSLLCTVQRTVHSLLCTVYSVVQTSRKLTSRVWGARTFPWTSGMAPWRCRRRLGTSWRTLRRRRSAVGAWPPPASATSPGRPPPPSAPCSSPGAEPRSAGKKKREIVVNFRDLFHTSFLPNDIYKWSFSVIIFTNDWFCDDWFCDVLNW